jgi:magnesium-dependent phosphatase 1
MVTKKLFVFDLDFTLWNAGGTWCDCTTPPYKKTNGFVTDSSGIKIVLYPDVREIIQILKAHDKLIAIASRTEEPTWAKQILELLDVRTNFDYEEIFPDRKTKHLKKIQQLSKINFQEMVFFDDEYRNIEDVIELGVTCEWVRNGINKKVVIKYV